MCIIVAKPRGVKMPSENILRNCFIANPDGAGMMISYNGKVYGYKGFMTFANFSAKLQKLGKRFGNLDKLAIVMHFRIGTHGSNNPHNTHPFPISEEYDDLRELEWISNSGVAHNGIISCTKTHPDVKVEDVSDTMVFIKRIIAPVSRNISVTKHKDILEGFQIAADSKLAFLDGKGNLECLGGFHEKDGVQYSNYSYYGYGRWYDPDDDDDVWSTKYGKFQGFHPYSYSGYGYGQTQTSLNDALDAEASKLSRKEECANEYGFTLCNSGMSVRMQDNEGVKYMGLNDSFAIDDYCDDLYFWDSEYEDFVMLACSGDYELFFEEDKAEIPTL